MGSADCDVEFVAGGEGGEVVGCHADEAAGAAEGGLVDDGIGERDVVRVPEGRRRDGVLADAHGRLHAQEGAEGELDGGEAFEEVEDGDALGGDFGGEGGGGEGFEGRFCLVVLGCFDQGEDVAFAGRLGELDVGAEDVGGGNRTSGR